jgi:hypothetical protein
MNAPWTRTPPRSRRGIRASFGKCKAIWNSEGAGNAGRSMRPQSRVRKIESTRGSHHGRTGITRHSPRNGFTTYNVISSVIGLCCHRRQQNCFRRLDASVEASEPHDFAVRLHAVRQRHVSVHRIPSRVSDDRDTPLWWTRRRGLWNLIWGKREGIYFWKWDWTSKPTDLPDRQNQAGPSV